jgi:hypothetical protein
MIRTIDYQGITAEIDKGEKILQNFSLCLLYKSQKTDYICIRF